MNGSEEHPVRTDQWGFIEYSQMVAGLVLIAIQVVAGVVGEGNWMLRVQIIFLAIVLMVSLVYTKRRNQYIERLKWEVSNNGE